MTYLPPGVGQKTWVGIGKETTFGTAVTPALFHSCDSIAMSDKNAFIDRPGPRGISGMVPPAPGSVSASGSLKPNPDMDVIGQLLAYAMGTQAAPAHPSGSTVAYTSKLTFGNLRVLPSFTLEWLRDIDCADYWGTCIDSMKLGWSPGKKLDVDLSVVSQQSQKQSSPATPTFSTLYPLTSDATGTSTTYNGTLIGVAGEPVVDTISLQLNNNLDKKYQNVGSAYVAGFPLGSRKVTGSLKLGFESDQAYQDFIANLDYAIAFNVASNSIADAAASGGPLPYQIAISLPNVRTLGHAVEDPTSGTIKQTLTFGAYHDFSGGNDDMSITLTNLASAVY